MLETFRRILRSLRPRALDDFGFVAAAEWLAKDNAERTGIPVQVLVTPPDLLLDGPRATAAYRILQEALSNAVRHSGATRIEVDIAGTSALFRLTIRDNGRGIPTRAAWRQDAMGVIGMRERARSLGGDTEIGPAPEGGTAVTLTLPLTQSQESAAA
jgi:signal transduction histidine kinase